QPATCERKPGLVEALLGAEDERGPGRADVGRRLRPALFRRSTHHLSYAGGERRVDLGIDANRGELMLGGDRRGSVARAMGDAPDDAGRPHWFAMGATRDRD